MAFSVMAVTKAQPASADFPEIPSQDVAIADGCATLDEAMEQAAFAVREGGIDKIFIVGGQEDSAENFIYDASGKSISRFGAPGFSLEEALRGDAFKI